MKIWFQNRRTKWKKLDNVSQTEASEQKQNGKSTINVTSPHSTRSSPASSPTGSHANHNGKTHINSSVTAELSAKITAKHNTKLKQHQQNGKTTKTLPINDLSPSLISDKLHSSHLTSPSAATLELKKLYHHQPVKLLNNNSSSNKNLMNNNDSHHHDVESRLSASKIAISTFKSTNKSTLTSPALAINLKRSDR